MRPGGRERNARTLNGKSERVAIGSRILTFDGRQRELQKHQTHGCLINNGEIESER
jgi:hypothetical protein